MLSRPVSSHAREILERLIRCPHPIPGEWLAPDRHPRVFCTRAELDRTRSLVASKADWRRRLLQEHQQCADTFLSLVSDSPAMLVPPPGSLFVYGLGMNLDPRHGKRMTWGGWEAPRRVLDCHGRPYPNDEWPDDGKGAVCPRSGKRYYFVAQANAHIVRELEQHILPALCDIAVLTESTRHAHIAAALLDAIAAVYPSNRRGPLDYPTSPDDVDRGGRLDRPYYQTARGLQNYVTCIDLLAATGALAGPSLAAAEITIREHLVRNLLWDGGWYCLDYTFRGFQLHNGHADYLRGAALVGLLLDRPAFAAPLLQGPLGFRSMIDVNLDRNGFYHEVSHGYASHTRLLYILLAEILHYAGLAGWQDLPEAYENPAFAEFLRAPFDKLALSGHVPAIGDAGPDRRDSGRPDGTGLPGFSTSDPLFREQLQTTWTRLVRAGDSTGRRAAAALIRAAGTPDGVQPPPSRWSVYHVTPEHERLVETSSPPVHLPSETSAVLGQKGLALLRGGPRGQGAGCQLFFGPVHNHGQCEALTWMFFADGAEWSFDPGYFNTHYRFGWTTTSVAHQAVTVNRHNVAPECGTGHLLAWKGVGNLQYAFAAHPGAYADVDPDGPYQRLVAQVIDPSSGRLAYWLDLSRVGKGSERDDSFHTQMQTAHVEGAEPTADPCRASLYGDTNLGNRVRHDLRLDGDEFEDKPFYWRPPGDGYAFLGNPRTAPLKDTVRITLTQPAFAGDATQCIVAFLDGDPKRTLIVADSPQAPGAPRVPYILRRDRGCGTSVFGKLVQMVHGDQTTPVQAFERLDPKALGRHAGRASAAAWLVRWCDGRRDLWLLTPPGNRDLWQVQAAGVPTLRTDGLLAIARFDETGQSVDLMAESAETVALRNGPAVSGRRQAAGAITGIRVDNGRTRVAVDWDDRAPHPSQLCGIAVTAAPQGQPRTWTLAEVRPEEAIFADLKPSLGATDFHPVADKPGWFRLAAGISRFFSAGSRPLRTYAIGRGVLVDGAVIGRIVDLADDAASVNLQFAPGRQVPATPFRGCVLDAAPGERLYVPLRLRWTP